VTAGEPEPEIQQESSMYELFMGLMTIVSLINTVMILIVRAPEVDTILTSVDTLFCLLFLADFTRSFRRAPSRRAYMFGANPGRSLPTGLFDLLGSIPTVGVFRIFRVFRLVRINRIVRARGARALAREFVERRAEAAIYVIVIASMFVLLLGSSLIAFIEPPAPDSNIKSGGDAFWWAFVTITTVGYGDRFPVTNWGRFVGMLTMAVGIGIFGVLTSYLSSVFLAPPPKEAASEDLPAATPEAEAVAGGVAPAVSETNATQINATEIADELRALRAELADVRRLLGATPGDATRRPPEAG
jgi:voltage-gated potassium channel